MQYRERRADGEVAHLEAAPWIVVMVRAWMLDPATWPPRVDVGALYELYRLLIALGSGKTLRQPPPRRLAMRSRPFLPSPFQPCLSLEGPRLASMTTSERKEALVLLATLLLEASGAAAPEGDDGHA